MITVLVRDERAGGELAGVLGCGVWQYKTGSRGFRGNGRLTLADGKRYMLKVELVEIGSKNSCDGEAVTGEPQGEPESGAIRGTAAEHNGG